ncbi:MAG TPA: hypothetical protein VF250_10210 [Conexibacter sp.]
MRFGSSSDISDERLTHILSSERLGTYVAHCGDVKAGIALYRWNAAMSAAFWPSLGHVEVALRNAMNDSLVARHARLDRDGSWLDDPASELDSRMRSHIAAARRRVAQRGKRVTDAQTISALGFGFWRFLVTRGRMALWPDLASGFPGAPDRRRETVEDPVARLHELRNRIAHHQRIWNRDLAARYADVLLVASYLDADLPAWIVRDCRVPALLRARPLAKPY